MHRRYFILHSFIKVIHLLANDARSSSSSSSNVSHGRIALAPKDTPISAQHGLSKEQLLRGLKIGTGKL